MKTQAVSIVDSTIVGEKFGDNAIRHIWADENRAAYWHLPARANPLSVG